MLKDGLPVRPDPVSDPRLGSRAPSAWRVFIGTEYHGEARSPGSGTAGGNAGAGPRQQRRDTKVHQVNRGSVKKRLLIASVAVLAFTAGSTTYAQNPGGLVEPGDPTAARPGILSKIAIDQKIGSQVPADIPFVDENGRQVKIGDYFGKRPVVLALVYYECPMLCTQVLNGLVGAVSVLNFDAGREFDVVAVSFNPKEGPAWRRRRRRATWSATAGRKRRAAGTS